MKSASIRLAIVITLFAGIAFAQRQQASRPTLTTGEIQSSNVVGTLGVPFGVCVPIRATVSRSDSNSKASQGRYFLKVTHVDGKPLRRPSVCSFVQHRFATKNVKIANDDFELYELRNGKRAGSLSGEQVRDLEKSYVGTQLELIVYETGGFRGIPENLPKEVLVWQDYGYGFQTELIVMDQISEPDAQPVPPRAQEPKNPTTK